MGCNVLSESNTATFPEDAASVSKQCQRPKRGNFVLVSHPAGEVIPPPLTTKGPLCALIFLAINYSPFEACGYNQKKWRVRERDP